MTSMTAILVLLSSPPARFHQGWRGPAPWQARPQVSASPRRCRPAGQYAQVAGLGQSCHQSPLPATQKHTEPLCDQTHHDMRRRTYAHQTHCVQTLYTSTAYCILHTTYCILYTNMYTSTAYCILHTTYCILHTNMYTSTAYCILHTTYCILYTNMYTSTAYCILHTTYCILHTNMYTSTAYCIQHTTYCILHTNTAHKHTVYMCTSEHCICVSPRHMHTCWPCLASHW